MSQVPDLIVDISSTIGTKIDARQARSSQRGDAAELEQRFRARAAELGEPYGLAYAEVFEQIRFS